MATEVYECVYINNRDDKIKEIVFNNVYEKALIAGENYIKEGYSEYDCEIFTQIIAEWMLHKTLDLYDGRIPEKFHEEILKKSLLLFMKLQNTLTKRIFHLKIPFQLLKVM